MMIALGVLQLSQTRGMVAEAVMTGSAQVSALIQATRHQSMTLVAVSLLKIQYVKNVVRKIVMDIVSPIFLVVCAVQTVTMEITQAGASVQEAAWWKQVVIEST